jgi:integrase
MKKVKDVFVFGCTVALRVSDLIALKLSNLRIVSGQYYLAVRSVKTSADTLVKLPPYAIQIILKYQKRNSKTLLPYFEKCKLNRALKKLLELAGFTNPVSKKREKRGNAVELFYKKGGQSKLYRFCDLASTHLMRRTAITNILSLGMPELIVRKISGHSPGSKDFYRYINWAQSYQDQESDGVFARLQEKNFQNIFQNVE